ncbi:hypothetical protein GCM10010145_14600 [Streptomyces ruber]|uniref:Uncharacterized protein n=2 Tax=Streptomyces TaxID=1883 RepID=A0A918EP07_9ACTN|nr:hypothetical protein GCM10010145_14600 [Streptomyces ruber]
MHVDVDDRNVGTVLQHRSDQLAAGTDTGGGDDFDVRFAFHQENESGADQLQSVSNHDSNRHALPQAWLSMGLHQIATRYRPAWSYRPGRPNSGQRSESR